MKSFFQKNKLPVSTSPVSVPTLEDYKKIPRSKNCIEGGLRIQGRFQKKYGPDKPLVSMVTIVFHGEKTVEQTIQSILNQTYDNIEYIIIDGGSTDGTLDILRKYNDKIAYWTSEPDQGISDAFNKGITASTGEIIGLINADDWLSENQIACGVAALSRTTSAFVFGDLLFHDSSGIVQYRINGDPDYADVIDSKMPELCHPTVLVKKSAFQNIGLFDTNLHFAMDYEWLLRLHRHGGRGEYVREITGHMRLSGLSDTSYVKALKEVRCIAVRYGQARWLAHCLFTYRVVKGFIRRILETRAPKSLYHRMRRMVNQRYTSQGY